MNYQKIYSSIIFRRKQEHPSGYFETHHIVPRSLGGSDSADNLVRLTAREHFICHLLLVKIHEDAPAYYKMVKAFFMMHTESPNQTRYVSSRKYERLRAAFSVAQRIAITGKNNPSYGKVWCVRDSASDCSDRSLFDFESVPSGWITTKELRSRLKLERNKKLQDEKHKQIESKLRKQYKLYSKVGFDEYVKRTGYKFSKPNLVQQFAKWLPEFVPQNGKKR
jgi:hypothetical protein